MADRCSSDNGRSARSLEPAGAARVPSGERHGSPSPGSAMVEMIIDVTAEFDYVQRVLELLNLPLMDRTVHLVE